MEEVPSFEVDLTEVGSFGFSDVAKSLAREDVSPGLMIVAVLVFIGDVDSSLVWVEAPFKVLQDVEIVLVKAVSSVEEAAEIGKLLSVLQEAVMVFVIRLLSVVVAVEMAKLGLSE